MGLNKPVDFTTAKLLKEKGFDEQLNYYYDSFGDIGSSKIKVNWNESEELLRSAPTIAEVVMWIHKEKGLWVNVMYMGFELKYSWSIDIITTSGSDWDSYGEEDDICYNSPTEAYSQAIIYTLKNLI